MNKLTKKFSLLLACVSIASVCGGAFASCGPRENEDIIIDDEKMQLYVGNEANGYGSAWLDETIKVYEELMKDHEFSNGKKGVQVVPAHSGYTGTGYINNIREDNTHVIFSEMAYYYDYVSRNVLMDITDAVTTPLTEFGENESIVDKMQAVDGTQISDALTGFDGKYYMMPWWLGLKGVIYDVELFDDKSLYFAKGGAPSEYERTNENVAPALSGSFSEYAFTNLAGERSAGPDGKYGTFDDGLAATYDEFFRLCDQMLTKTITPFVWTGQYQYGDMMFRGLYHDYEGIDNLSILYEQDGVAYDLVESFSLNADGTLDESSIVYKGNGEGYQIDKTNAYEAHAQEGKLYALSFAKRLLSNPDYLSTQCFNPTFSHSNAQRYYLYSKYDASYETCAMITDYTCFMNESASVFEEMEDAEYENAGRYERNLAYMPLPKADASKIDGEFTGMNAQHAMCFINGNITDAVEKELAVHFFRFCHTDEMLKLFNKVSGGIRPFEFEYTDEELKEVDAFAQSMYFVNQNYNMFFPVRYNKLWLYNMSYFGSDGYGLDTSAAGGTSRIIKTLKDNASLTIADYFNGILSKYNRANWYNRMGPYLED